jgi:metallo-beta-lactamase family protein
MKIFFCGATTEVTGSKTFVELPDGLVMIDCGLVQGPDNAQELNNSPLPFSYSEIQHIIITHAHLDHSGLLPRMVKKGFSGKIFCTPPTAKLIRVILLDSANLVEEDFYSEQDVMVTLSMIETVEWDRPTEVLGASFKFLPAGHILGASSVLIQSGSKRVLFSGDLGRSDDALIPGPLECPKADAIIMESTYGGKVRQGDYHKELHTFLDKISREQRVGIIASFAVARAQMLMTLISEFYHRHPEEKVRVVIDSPMMKEASRVYKQYAHLTLKKESLKEAMEEFEVMEHQREWETLKKKSGPLIILSSSGMLTGGRIKRHLENWQDDSKAILFLPGYQGEGTPGRAFVEGQRQMKTGEDEWLTWAGEVWNSDAFSSHADQNELLNWLGKISKDTHLYLIHGEQESKDAFKKTLHQNGYTNVSLPHRGTTLII